MLKMEREGERECLCERDGREGMCVCEREGGREGERECLREGERERESHRCIHASIRICIVTHRYNMTSLWQRIFPISNFDILIYAHFLSFPLMFCIFYHLSLFFFIRSSNIHSAFLLFLF